MEGATSRAVADAHQKDVKLQDKYGVRLLTYWFDEQHGVAFCLMDAPAKDNVRRLHEEAHGLVPHRIMEVDPETVEAFLGRIEDPPPAAGSEVPAGDTLVDSAFRTIMFTDMKDSTAITTRLGDREAIKVFRTHDALTRDALKEHGGREIQHTGDGFMVSFTSACQAVECAVAIQKSMSVHNERQPERKINVRIGISAGEPVEQGRNLFGSTVQLTSRICDRAQPDQILTAPLIRDLCLGRQFTFADQGEFALKGFDQPLRLYEVLWQD